MLTRRNILKLAGLAPPLMGSAFAWSHDEFWNSKDPAQWTEKETTQILNHSPWAKQAAIESQGNQSRMGMPGSGGMGRSGGGMGGNAGGMGGGGRGMGGGGMGQGQGGNNGDWGGSDSQNVHALVRWESALPVAAAEKKSAPPEAAQAYIISVSGLPSRLQNNSAEDDDDRAERMSGVIKRYTSLDRKGKDPISPDHADFTEDVDGGTWRFSFPRAGNPITVEDKDVTFMTKVGRISLRAKFSLKDMLYKDQLAL